MIDFIQSEMFRSKGIFIAKYKRRIFRISKTYISESFGIENMKKRER
jgi:hypothetical protein